VFASSPLVGELCATGAPRYCNFTFPLLGKVELRKCDFAALIIGKVELRKCDFAALIIGKVELRINSFAKMKKPPKQTMGKNECIICIAKI
jgi:hypothetical protein